MEEVSSNLGREEDMVRRMRGRAKHTAIVGALVFRRVAGVRGRAGRARACEYARMGVRGRSAGRAWTCIQTLHGRAWACILICISVP